MPNKNDTLPPQTGGANKAILRSATAFAEDTVQKDGIAINVRDVSPALRCVEVTLKASVGNLHAVTKMFDDAPDIPEDAKPALMVIAEEIFVNICSYAYKDGVGDATITFEILPGKVIMTFVDSGVPFDPISDIIKAEEYDHETGIGGLGRLISFSLADEYSYWRTDGKNNLRIVKKFKHD